MRKLQKSRFDFYVVKEGDTLQSLALELDVSAERTAQMNHLTRPIAVGQVLLLPPVGNLYTVQQEGEERLCASKQRYQALNGEIPPYPSKKVRI